MKWIPDGGTTISKDIIRFLEFSITVVGLNKPVAVRALSVRSGYLIPNKANNLNKYYKIN